MMEYKLSDWLKCRAYFQIDESIKKTFQLRAKEAKELEDAAEVIPRIDKAIAVRKEKLKKTVAPTTSRIVEVLEYVRQ